MTNKPSKPSRDADMRKTASRKQYGTVDNRNKVVPSHLPHPKSMQSKEEAKVDNTQNDNTQK